MSWKQLILRRRAPCVTLCHVGDDRVSGGVAFPGEDTSLGNLDRFYMRFCLAGPVGGCVSVAPSVTLPRQVKTAPAAIHGARRFRVLGGSLL